MAVVTIDNPPVNALSASVRKPFHDAILALSADRAVAAIVIACAGRTFVAGADIRKFGKPPERPHLPDLIAALENAGKPTVAAIHGAAFGGGLELALGCSWRVALVSAKLGLPEVKLGLLPGAGGTARLPRLVGASKALRMIVSGDPVAASQALADGLVDEVFDADLLANAIAFADQATVAEEPARRVRDREEKLFQARADLDGIDAEVAALLKKVRGLDAPRACAEAVRNALTLPFDDALAAERAAFFALLASDQSRAQRHLFFAEREAVKIPRIGPDIIPRALRSAGVVGAGTMGGGIAMALAAGGVPVAIVEANEEASARGMARIRANYDASVARGALAPDERDRRLALMTPTIRYEALGEADLVIEAAFEDIAVKRAIFSRLDEIAKPGAVLATNTSYLDVDAIAVATGRPADVLGLHFFSPANVMKLLEIVRGNKTAPDVLATALALAKRIGKVPVVVGVCPGFVGNRLLAARSAELENLLLEGATPSTIDAAFVEFGFPMGPFAMADLAGLDIGWANRKAHGRAAVIADALCELGRFGQKTGRGYYRYAEGARTGTVDPDVETLVAAKSAQAGSARRQIEPGEILERTLHPMINEAAKILAEGIASRASDIDVVWVHGYGFPIGKVGPRFWADMEGLTRIVERLDHWREATGRGTFSVAPLLRDLAAGGGKLAEFKNPTA
ncbi:MAG: enoyl-CoA hydratase/isomerase family protein [Phyllobacteriaceae bacterium]|nr:enoyl-CoA hydratase/isomerase family protein [Phyllobacteriaceae bacterium]